MLASNPLTKWDYRWLEEAKLRATYSKDPSTKVGAVIAQGKKHLSFGYNGFPESVPDNPDWLDDREIKYRLVTHAEVNAVFNARESVRGWDCYTYPLPPCASCASLLSSAGIVRVISLVDLTATGTKKYLDFSDTEFVFEKAGIEYICLRQ